jgi:hypothetical protein
VVVKKICSVEGCGRPVGSWGWCATHYARWRAYGDVKADIPIAQNGQRLDGTPKKRRSDIKKRVQAGQRFGRLTALEDGAGGRAKIECRCDCGRTKTMLVVVVLRSQSCGCIAIEKAAARQGAPATHGHWVGGRSSPTYASWTAMKQRTGSPKHPAFDRYRHRKPCAGLIRFEDFVRVVGERPEGKTLDRWPDNDGGYWCGHCDECIANGWPLNVRWATHAEQTANRPARRSRLRSA